MVRVCVSLACWLPYQCCRALEPFSLTMTLIGHTSRLDIMIHVHANESTHATLYSRNAAPCSRAQPRATRNHHTLHVQPDRHVLDTYKTLRVHRSDDPSCAAASRGGAGGEFSAFESAASASLHFTYRSGNRLASIFPTDCGQSTQRGAPGRTRARSRGGMDKIGNFSQCEARLTANRLA